MAFQNRVRALDRQRVVDDFDLIESEIDQLAESIPDTLVYDGGGSVPNINSLLVVGGLATGATSTVQDDQTQLQICNVDGLLTKLVYYIDVADVDTHWNIAINNITDLTHQIDTPNSGAAILDLTPLGYTVSIGDSIWFRANFFGAQPGPTRAQLYVSQTGK